MDTMRLRAIQQPSHVEDLLESYVASRNLLPRDAEPLERFDELSHELQSLVRRMQDEEYAWRAWTDQRHTWFFFGEMSLPLSRERGMPVLRVSRYDEEAQMQDTGVWLRSRAGQWERCNA